MKFSHLALVIACMVAGVPAIARAQTPHVTGINLEGVDYPFPVQRFSFEAQGQKLEMAYMDIRPLESNGKTVVLLHGKNFGGDYWGRTAGDLSSAGYRVVVPDQIGFGKSSKPQQFQWTFQQLCLNTAALLDHAGVGEVTIVGHSMGGMIGTRFALMFPDRVRQLVLVNPIGLEDWKALVPYTPLDKLYAGELKKTRDEIRGYMQDVYYDGRWKPEYDRPVDLLAGMIASPDWPRMAWVQAATTDMIFTQPVVHEFGDLRMPVLLIVGTRDRTAIGSAAATPQVREMLGRYDQLGRKVAERMPDATLVELDDVGHMPMLEAYDRYLTPLREFLAK